MKQPTDSRRARRNHEFERIYCLGLAVKNARNKSFKYRTGKPLPSESSIDPDVLRWAMRACKPRYHVSYERAYRVVCSLLAGRSPGVSTEQRMMMWREIAAKAKSLIDATGCSISKAVEAIVENGYASRLFVTEGVAKRMLSHVMTHQRSYEAYERYLR